MIRRAVNATSTSIRDALLVDGRKSETETESGYCEVRSVYVCMNRVEKTWTKEVEVTKWGS